MPDLHDNSTVLEERWARLKARMLDVKPHLLRNGSVHALRRPGCTEQRVLRYRERVGNRRCQRAIYISGEALGQKAKALIQRWRREAQTPADARKAEIHQLLRFTGEGRGYSQRAIKRLVDAADGVLDDPQAALAFAYQLEDDVPEIRDGKRPGRPSKGALW